MGAPGWTVEDIVVMIRSNATATAQVIRNKLHQELTAPDETLVWLEPRQCVNGFGTAAYAVAKVTAQRLLPRYLAALAHGASWLHIDTWLHWSVEYGPSVCLTRAEEYPFHGWGDILDPSASRIRSLPSEIVNDNVYSPSFRIDLTSVHGS